LLAAPEPDFIFTADRHQLAAARMIAHGVSVLQLVAKPDDRLLLDLREGGLLVGEPFRGEFLERRLVIKVLFLAGDEAEGAYSATAGRRDHDLPESERHVDIPDFLILQFQVFRAEDRTRENAEPSEVAVPRGLAADMVLEASPKPMKPEFVAIERFVLG